MKKYDLAEAAERVRQMESCFDTLRDAAEKSPESLRHDDSLRELLRVLLGYYESGEWLRDYELDEAGLLPPELKRGVLSQDAVYNFITELDEK